MAYDNRGRSARAQQTRVHVLDAARTAYLELGYAGATIRLIADRAGVSQETIYKTFGTKAALLKAVYDVTLAGDDEPIPMAERPESQAVAAARTAREGAAAYAAMGRMIAGHVGPLIRVVLGARGTDPDLDRFVTTTDGERLFGATLVTGQWHQQGWLRAGLDQDRARDLVWTLTAPAVYLSLLDRGWDDAQYENWLAQAFLAMVLTEAG